MKLPIFCLVIALVSSLAFASLSETESQVFIGDLKALSSKTSEVIGQVEQKLFANESFIDVSFKKSDQNEDDILVRWWIILKDVVHGNMDAVSYVNVTDYRDIPSKPHKSSLFIINANQVPKRREEGQDFIHVDDPEILNSPFGAIFLPLMNQMGHQMEQNAGRRFFKITIGKIPEDLLKSLFQSDPHLLAIYDVGQGQVLVVNSFFEHLKSLVTAQEDIKLIEESYNRLKESLPTNFTAQEMMKFVYRIPDIFGSSLLFCIACTVVLAISLPFVFNYVFISIANLLCKHYQLDPDTCEALWWTSIALAYLMIFPAAFVVLKVCKLTTCGKKASQLYQIGTMTLASCIMIIRNLIKL